MWDSIFLGKIPNSFYNSQGCFCAKQRYFLDPEEVVMLPKCNKAVSSKCENLKNYLSWDFLPRHQNHPVQGKLNDNNERYINPIEFH